jgi:hypothetical protein
MSRDDRLQDAEALVRKALSRLGHSVVDDAEVKSAAAKIVKAHPLPAPARRSKAA